MFGRDKLAQASDEIGAFLKAVDHIKELQVAQREMAEAMRRIGDRIQALEVEFRALKAEIRTETLRETQSIVNAVQGQFYQRLQDVAVDIAVLREQSRLTMDKSSRLGSPRGDNGDPPQLKA